jgi:uncharacterized protein YndB with AHSA1/START domain
MAHVYERLDDKPYQSHHLLVETVIAHPVEAVWAQALDISSWMTKHRLETIDGKSGTVGHFERVFPTGVGDDVPEPHYHLYGVAAIVPHKLIMLEVFPEHGGSYGDTMVPADYVGFDGILFTDLDGKTKVSVVLTEMSANDLSGTGTDEEKAGTMTAYFDNLRSLLDGEERAA